MKKEKGFTLIELLAVIVIMGILMAVAVPSIGKIIDNSRKNVFVDLAKKYGNSVEQLWKTDDLYVGENGESPSGCEVGQDYYVLIDTKNSIGNDLLEDPGVSPWGKKDIKGYVRVRVISSDEIKIYVALSDGTHGIYDDLKKPKISDKLVRKDVITNINIDINKQKRKEIEEIPFTPGNVITAVTDGVGGSIDKVEIYACIDDYDYYDQNTTKNTNKLQKSHATLLSYNPCRKIDGRQIHGFVGTDGYDIGIIARNNTGIKSIKLKTIKSNMNTNFSTAEKKNKVSQKIVVNEKNEKAYDFIYAANYIKNHEIIEYEITVTTTSGREIKEYIEVEGWLRK